MLKFSNEELTFLRSMNEKNTIADFSLEYMIRFLYFTKYGSKNEIVRDLASGIIEKLNHADADAWADFKTHDLDTDYAHLGSDEAEESIENILPTIPGLSLPA